MISHVLDTCAVLDLASGRWSDPVARESLSSASDPVVLCVSVWELARKLRLGKIKLPCQQSDVAAFAEKIAARHSLRIVPLDVDICAAAEMLPPHHEDPFDRMIIALAVRAGCPIFTTDRKFDRYPVEIIRQR
ncbi:MAG: type II toxin-antitoxin system VapC family toxin [Chthoniobacterales bacterium]